MSHTFLIVGIGCLLIGATSGVAGSFLLLRRESLLGDAVAHCALPGVAIAFLLTGERQLANLLVGALVSGLLGAWSVNAISRNTRISNDGALALVLASYFGLGLVLLTYIQKIPNAAQAGLQGFLFGQAAAMLNSDVAAALVLGLFVVLLAVVFWKEWKVISFDPDFAASLGLRVRLLDACLVLALSGAVVVGLQAVGVVLMSAMVVAPAAAARQWTNHLGTMVLISGLVGSVSGVAGVAVSSLGSQLPTGPLIVLVAALFVIFSLLFGRERGLVWLRSRRLRHRRGIVADQLLRAFADIATRHSDPFEPRELGLLPASQLGRKEYADLLDLLERRGWVRRVGRYQWALTESGLQRSHSDNVTLF